MFLTDLELGERDSPDVWRVLAPLVWADDVRRITVPVGVLTDLASIPDFLKGIPALDVNGRSRSPAVLHDWLYRTHELSRAQADGVFRAALLSRGVPKAAAWAFWAGVRLGGSAAYAVNAYGPQRKHFGSQAAYLDWRARALPGRPPEV